MPTGLLRGIMQTYTLNTPVNIAVGGVGNTITVSSLQLTGIGFTSTPSIAQIGTGALNITLTDPKSGYQETISYMDASVIAFWNTQTANLVTGDELQDTVAKAVFTKLVADSRLPAGNLSSGNIA